MTTTLQQLSAAQLRALTASLREGRLAAGLDRHAVEQIAGPLTAAVCADLAALAAAGFSSAQAAVLVETVAQTREQTFDPATILDLVLSGPEVPGVPTRDTAAVMHSLIEGATSQVLLVGYAVYNGRKLFERLAARMRENKLKVTLCLEVSRKYGDTSLETEIISRFAREFHTKHWPWAELPEVYFDPRSLAEAAGQKSSLHAKCVVIDDRQAFVTSANFTEAAQQRNIEAGVMILHPPLAARISAYFRALIAEGRLTKCPLPP